MLDWPTAITICVLGLLAAFCYVVNLVTDADLRKSIVNQYLETIADTDIDDYKEGEEPC